MNIEKIENNIKTNLTDESVIIYGLTLYILNNIQKEHPEWLINGLKDALFRKMEKGENIELENL